MQIVIITGLSGAGKTQAIICLEDLDYYCIDNMPPALIKNFIELASREESGIKKTAFVMDVRGGEFFADMKSCLSALDSNGTEYKLVFLEAADEILIRRFNETRRSHPLSKSPSTLAGIKKERKALNELRELADYIIDTSNMKSMRLREEIKKLFSTESKAPDFTVNLLSFGYKNGIPLDADMVFDVRFVPNPFYVAELKNLTGNNRKVRQYVMKFAESANFFKKADEMINEMIPCFIREGKYHLNLAVGCTGGRHRSVAFVNEFADLFSAQGRRTVVEHRDL